jgi:uncharacterized protein YbjT (DUF2867 family)
MKIAITTPTGRVGSAVTEHLLNTEHELVLLVRDPDKVKSFTARGASARAGSLDDPDYFKKATAGVDVLFLVVPPDVTSDDYRASQRRVGDAAIAAITANRIPRVVFLSSIAAHLGEGYGPISGLSEVEQELRALDTDVALFRPGFFMENFFDSVGSIASDGAVYLPAAGRQAMAPVAVADIAKFAAELVQDRSWSGKHVVELVGPEDVSFDAAAEAIGSAVGKKVAHIEVTPGQALEGLMASGISKNVAESYVEMYDRFGDGTVAPEGTPRRGETTFEVFAAQTLGPFYEAMSQEG